jgi:hypothetical protein
VNLLVNTRHALGYELGPAPVFDLRAAKLKVSVLALAYRPNINTTLLLEAPKYSCSRYTATSPPVDQERETVAPKLLDSCHRM